MSRFARVLTSPRGVITLSIAQALFTAALAIDLTLTGLTGYQLADDKSLATLPFATITIAGACSTWFAARLMRRLGCRKAFMIGGLACAIGGGVSAWSVVHADFWLFCAGTAAVGVFQSFAQYYRLVAADGVDLRDKAGAVSTVLAGGVVAAVIGPLLAAWSKGWLWVPFAGSYLAVALLGCGSVALFAIAYRDRALDLAVSGSSAQARSVRRVLLSPEGLAALANAIVGGVVMMFVMTAAPLAAMHDHYTIDDGASVIQWHLVGMYAPSLFAGQLMRRFGTATVLFIGIGLSALCCLTMLAYSSLIAYHAALLCLGIGWNFMFIGGTALLASSYQLHERTRVQGVAELARYVTTGVATLSAGPALEHLGWLASNALMLPLLILPLIATYHWTRASRVPRECGAGAGDPL